MLIGGRGDRVALRIHSSSFDPFLRVQSRSGYWDEAQDTGSDRDAALSFVFLQPAQVEVVVRSTDPTEGGSYELEVERLTPARALRAGTETQGRMRAGTEIHLLQGQKGSAVSITVGSDDFDPVATLIDRLGRRAYNDDSWGETTSRIHHVFTDDEPVALAVARTSEGEPGLYTITVEEPGFEGGSVADLTGIAAGDVVRGRLGTADMRRQKRYVHRYTFDAEANQALRLELVSDDFDAWLEVVGPDGVLASDDDGLGGYNAVVDVVGREAGPYTARVTSAGDWETGFYELSFTSGGIVEPLMEIEGGLELRDQRDISGRYFDRYTFDVEDGQSLTVEMTSADLDAYLYVWDPTGEEVLSDDDGGGDTDARVTVQDATPGQWTVYATSNDTGATGEYSLRVLAY
jgi:hypothetical protein